jgi:hypothetical protein
MSPRIILNRARAFVLVQSIAGLALAQSDPQAAEAVPPAAPDNMQAGVSPAMSDTSNVAMIGPESSVPMTQPRADRVEHTWPNRPMLITGAVVLVGTYGASAIVAATSDRAADDKLFIPVVGPWLDLKNRDCETNDCGSDTFNKALLIGDGALQGLGALTLVLSLVIPEARTKPWYLIGDDNLTVMPQVGHAVTGLSAFGRF